MGEQRKSLFFMDYYCFGDNDKDFVIEYYRKETNNPAESKIYSEYFDLFVDAMQELSKNESRSEEEMRKAVIQNKAEQGKVTTVRHTFSKDRWTIFKPAFQNDERWSVIFRSLLKQIYKMNELGLSMGSLFFNHLLQSKKDPNDVIFAFHPCLVKEQFSKYKEYNQTPTLKQACLTQLLYKSSNLNTDIICFCRNFLFEMYKWGDQKESKDMQQQNQQIPNQGSRNEQGSMNYLQKNNSIEAHRSQSQIFNDLDGLLLLREMKLKIDITNRSTLIHDLKVTISMHNINNHPQLKSIIIPTLIFDGVREKIELEKKYVDCLEKAIVEDDNTYKLFKEIKNEKRKRKVEELQNELQEYIKQSLSHLNTRDKLQESRFIEISNEIKTKIVEINKVKFTYNQEAVQDIIDNINSYRQQQIDFMDRQLQSNNVWRKVFDLDENVQLNKEESEYVKTTIQSSIEIDHLCGERSELNQMFKVYFQPI